MADYGEGQQSVMLVRFDLGDDELPPRLHTVITYPSVPDTPAIETITVGNESWRRIGDGEWTMTPYQGSVYGQIQVLMPHVEPTDRVEVERRGALATLRWFDQDRHADAYVTIDPETGIPQRSHRLRGGSEIEITVVYHGWNVMIDIESPVLS